jgi:carbon-monoxide dehydrogenase medium subunit
MYTHHFRYVRAQTLAEAERAFGEADDARYLAGGQTLIPAMKLRLASPATLIDIARIRELGFVTERNGAIEIGAGTTHADVADSPVARAAIPAVAELAGMIGDPAVRHRGTIGGSIANNDPAADYPAAVLALNARIHTTRRSIDADDMFTGLFATQLVDGEILTAVSFPRPRRAAYMKFRHPASRYALVGVFVTETDDGVRVAVTGAGTCVFRVAEMEAALNRTFAPEAIADIRIPADGLASDLFGSAEYRAHLVTVMAKRAVQRALERA